MLSGSIGTQEEAARAISEIEKTYQDVAGGAFAVYQLIDPQIDASRLIRELYFPLARVRKTDIKPMLAKGVGILTEYFVTKEMMAQISQAGKRHDRQGPNEMQQAA